MDYDVSPAIRQLANLIRTRRKAGDQPYTLLLGSSLSLTPEVRQAVCDSDDWEAFWTAIQGLSATVNMPNQYIRYCRIARIWPANCHRTKTST